MVEREPGNHARQRAFDHVRGVEPSTETDLEQRDVGRMAREQHECRGSLHFEHRNRCAAVFRFALRQSVAELGVVDKPAAAVAAEAKAFIETNQIRRSVDVNPLAGGFERRSHKGDGGAFAVGASYMDGRRNSPLRIIKRCQEALDAIEGEIDPFRMQRQKPRQHGIHGHWIGRCIGLAGTHAMAGAMAADGAGSLVCGTLLAVLRKSRHSFAIVARNS
jgi:hypothetical protein